MSKESSRRSLVIILHEIYGVNDHIQFFSEMIVKEGFDVLIPNLIHRDSFSYDQEEIAYQYYMNEIGFEKSLREVKEIVKENKEKYDQILIMGFSIGATIAWMLSEYEVGGIIGYYGSRIRNHKEIEPKCPVLLFFPNREKSFNVMDVEQELKKKKNTLTKIVEAEHGFMNPFHQNYNFEQFKNCVKSSIEFLKQIEGNIGRL
ncbi:dienelactone hydrolase family protein [Paenibacillus sp. Marseille-Q4541]|uniref:dienelactone hydrolase family protein n=1 Tax=Paenibacillus sp. Marseille-Q4541 TaxID=2831522 RepID=UPI001BABFCFC|nr:dienelactone hydrolase family protein [Paenibacillus sp. Marseille-Q4541]